MNTSKKIQLVIPSTADDYIRNNRDLSLFFEFLPIKEIVYIGPSELGELLGTNTSNANVDKVKYINENDIVPITDVKKAIINRLAKEGFSIAENSRLGWYYQQFLKMAFSFICPNDYYMTWDSDTIPTHKIEMFDENGNPFFDIKEEYEPAYFHTIENLFGYKKCIRESFISEHMVFNVKLMKQFIDDIMSAPFDGTTFFEKIINAINISDFKTGFSEFETYGTWVANKHPDMYTLRDWNSMRMAGYFFNPNELSESDMKWLSVDFDALTFERYNPYIPQLAIFFRDPQYKTRMSAQTIYETFLKSDLIPKQTNGKIMPS